MKREEETTRPRAPATMLILISLLGVAACKDKALRKHVDNTCSLLAADIERAAQKYEEFASWSSGRTPDETWNKQELSLPCRWRIEARGACALQLMARLHFCINAKKGDTKAIDDLTTRTGTAFDTFSVGTDPSLVAAATRELATIVSSVRKLETKE